MGDHTEVYPEKKTKTSKFTGVSYYKRISKWRAAIWSKNKKRIVSNGFYNDEETWAHASDTLARKLMDNGEENHNLNFPDDYTEIHPQKRSASIYFGVTYSENMWCARRWSRNEKKKICYGKYENEERAAHASDTLARKLTENGEINHKLNFPEDYTATYREKNQKKRKRPNGFGHTQNN